MNSLFLKGIITAILLLCSACSDFFDSPQSSDKNFKPQNTTITFEQDSPLVIIDEAHHNFHKRKSRYYPFTQVLESDGYEVKSNTSAFTMKQLHKADILVISNALNKQNTRNWDLPNYPAFEPEEIKAVVNWVKNGGSLLLIADHMPFPKASEALGAAFGFTFTNGYAMDANNQDSLFNLDNATLREHPITKGMNEDQAIQQVRSFMGQAFQYPKDAKPLMVWGESALVKMPKKSWALNWDTPSISAANLAQGATLEYHDGRVAIFGEAAMFTSQTDGKSNNASGLVSKGAEQNEQFLLNVMHWLSRKV